MKNKTDLRTAYTISREARELAIYNEYQKLVEQPFAMKTVVDAIIMEKYDIHSAATVWAIRKRVEARLKKELTA